MAERNDIFPSNSNKSRQERALANTEPTVDREHPKPVAKRLEGKKQETFGQKFARLFLAEDVGDIGEYLVKDLIIPTIKDTFLNFMAAALWGDRRAGSVYRADAKQRTNYNKISTVSRVGIDREHRKEAPRENYADERKQLNISDIVFKTKIEADTVLRRMLEHLDEYGVVTVGYLYDLMEESGPYTAEYYGWRNLRYARVIRVRNGFSLELPDPVRLEH